MALALGGGAKGESSSSLQRKAGSAPPLPSCRGSRGGTTDAGTAHAPLPALPLQSGASAAADLPNRASGAGERAADVRSEPLLQLPAGAATDAVTAAARAAATEGAAAAEGEEGDGSPPAGSTGGNGGAPSGGGAPSEPRARSSCASLSVRSWFAARFRSEICSSSSIISERTTWVGVQVSIAHLGAPYRC